MTDRERRIRESARMVVTRILRAGGIEPDDPVRYDMAVAALCAFALVAIQPGEGPTCGCATEVRDGTGILTCTLPKGHVGCHCSGNRYWINTAPAVEPPDVRVPYQKGFEAGRAEGHAAGKQEARELLTETKRAVEAVAAIRRTFPTDPLDTASWESLLGRISQFIGEATP